MAHYVLQLLTCALFFCDLFVNLSLALSKAPQGLSPAFLGASSCPSGYQQQRELQAATATAASAANPFVANMATKEGAQALLLASRGIRCSRGLRGAPLRGPNPAFLRPRALGTLAAVAQADTDAAARTAPAAAVAAGREAPLRRVFTRTKQIATIGPASWEKHQIEDLFLSGVDVFRLNFSHGLFSEKYQQYKYIREIEHKYQTPIGVLADLPGPKLRLSVFDPDEVTLVKGQKFILDASAVPGGPQRGPLQQKWVLGALRVGHRVLIDDGKVRLRVIELSPRLQQHQQRQHMQQQQQVQQQGEEEEDGAGDSSSGPSQDNAWVLCVVETGGPISSKKGVSLPDTYVPVSALTKRDEQIAAMVTEWGVDWIALSFVQSAADIHKLRRVITAQANALEGGPQGAPEADIPRAFAGPIPEAPGRAPAPASLGTVGCVGPPCVPPLIMAKIERAGALQQLGAIAAAADGLMVARGDLGLELNSEFVPKAQRDITAAGRQTGKPVVVATQMLETMMTNPLPSRAEAADVAAAVMSGAAAVMLSGETAASSRGPHIARMQHSIIQQTEADPKYWALNTLKSPQAATVFAAAAAEAGTHPWGAPSKQGEERQESPTGPLEALSEGSQGKPEPEVTTEALAVGAEMMARVSAAKAILLNTKDSRGGPYLSSLRPKAPIVAATEDLKAARRLQLYWGVHPIFLGPRPQGPEEISKVKEGLRQSDGDMDEGWVDAAKRGARAEGFIKGQGDLVVVVGPPNQRGAEDEVSSEAGAEEAVRICTAA